VRDRIERAFAAWGHWLYPRARAVLALTLLFVVGLGTQLPQVELDTSTEAFLKEGDAVRLRYDAFREQFGRDERVIIAIEGDVFDLAFLERLRALHRDLEDEVPQLQDVTSLVNARDTRGEGDELIVGDLLEDWPRTPEDLARIRERALANPLYRDQLLDASGRVTTVLIETDAYSQQDGAGDELGGFDAGSAPAEPRRFLTGEENAVIVEAIWAVTGRYEAPDFRVHVAGTPAMVHYFQVWMQRDMARFTLLAIAAIGAFLALLFRRVVGVVLPLAVAILALISTLGLMGLAGVAITLPMQILPSFLLAVGVGGVVHILVIFFQALGRGEVREDAIAHSLGHSGLAVVMTSLTTAGGLASFVTADLGPVAELGVTAPIGVLLALVLTLVLTPAALAVLPLREGRPSGSAGPLARRWLVWAGLFATTHARPVVLVWAGVMAVSALGAAQLRFSHEPLSWFPADNPFRVASVLVNEKLRGSMFLEVLVDSGAENGLHEPAVLDRMDEMRRWASSVQRGDIYVGKTVSLVDVTKEIHQALNENRREFHAIPRDRQLVAQELLLFENSGSDDLEDLVDPQFRRARVTLKLPLADAVQYPAFIDDVEENFARILAGEAGFEVTGLMSIMARTFTAVIHTMATSYVVAFAVITPLMVLLVGSVRIGLLSMLPNLAPILVTLGVMGWAGLRIDFFTLMIGSIAIGLAVDDTIHFMHNFRRYHARSGDVVGAVRETLATAGQAMLFTSLVLATGFALFAFATLTVLTNFGLLTGLTILVAFLADLTLAPALIALVVGRERAPSNARVTEGTT
jgi:predicted RND superfamily exporter protein